MQESHHSNLHEDLFKRPPLGLEIKDDVFSTGPLLGLAWCSPTRLPLNFLSGASGALHMCRVPITLKIQLKASQCLFLTLTRNHVSVLPEH